MVINALKDDGVTEPLPGYCLPPDMVVLLDVLRLLRLRLREECDSDEIIALPNVDRISCITLSVWICIGLFFYL